MAKTKTATIRISQAMADALCDAKIEGEVLGNGTRSLNKTDTLTVSFQGWVQTLLRVNINPHQVNTVTSPDETFRQYTNLIKATQGKKGYGFTTKNKRTRLVYGPASHEAS